MRTTSQRLAGAALGLVFGFVLCWSGMASPAVIREALLFEDAYLFLFFGAAVVTATAGLQLVRRLRPRAVLTGQAVAWSGERPGRRHVAGALVFGTGWGITNVCPGPVATQVGQGIGWGVVLMAGVVLGVWLYQREGARETEPARDAPPAVTAPTTA